MYEENNSFCLICPKCDMTMKKLKPKGDYALRWRCPKCKHITVIWEYPLKMVVVYIN